MSDSKVEILLIESDQILLDLIQLSLEQQDYQVVVAHNGEEALAAFQRHQPKVVLLDLFLHQTNGLALIRQLKELIQEEQTTIIILSALGYREVIQQAMDAGAKDFILKPVNADMLIDRIKKVFEQSHKPKVSKPEFPKIL
jgi:DNA-binding response OmpR family regulator